MAHKQVLFRSAAREKILYGATQLADAVRVTLGPRSKAVLIEKKWGAPLVCNDGVTIAKEFDLKDPVENLGARMMREAADHGVDFARHEVGRGVLHHVADTRQYDQLGIRHDGCERP